jgi:hypothetical protein
VDSFIVTEDTNILTLMQSTVRNCLLRLYVAAGTTMADAEQNDAIKAHVRRTASDGNDLDEDVWSTRSIYQSARSVPASTTTTAVLQPSVSVQALTTSGRTLRGRPTTASHAATGAGARQTTAQATAEGGGGSGIGGGSAEAAHAEGTGVAQETEDHEDEVTDINPPTAALTQDRYEHMVTLLSQIQGNDTQSAQSTLQVLMSGGKQATTVVATHPSNSDLLLWAHRQGYQKPDSYKTACETSTRRMGWYALVHTSL